MRHYFLKNKLYAFPFEKEVLNLDFLTEEQERFLEKNPQAQIHEIRSCVLDSDKPVDLTALKAAAKDRISGMAIMRRDFLMPAAKREAAAVVYQLGQDGSISLQVAMDRLMYFNAISTALQIERLRIARLIDRAETPQAVNAAIESCHIHTIKTGKERYE